MRLPWWHGNVRQALFGAEWLVDGVKSLENDDPGLKRIAREFWTALS